ncbi:NAD(P)-dependent dehydrogenase, short-chain alcohol dehydrogenase family [Mesobacillus persicus]|uniref:NAD(P)-dependent dehydrogenase, short-chain alcohol dehydrogenase family n=1 Tax=Mesobacillus persicus TaxID=930146 RepID=A0A1H8DA57_9BACI|nr:SDR family oxidoreductase [Mesobacillus persicus]SEN04036.1 NAD(P)-dependent dehydrogenase, short-chain alcohol dehydrogenase family [Mesobacillus persicus]
MKLKDKVAFVTGGSSGIGRGICLAFAKEGASIVFVGLNEEKGKRTENELLAIGCDALFLQADVNNRELLPSLIDKTVERFGKIDILVNNAQSSKNVPLEETTDDVMDLALNTGLWSTFILMRSALPHLKATKGKVINFVSAAGMIGLSKQASYAATKEAIRGLSRVAATEWGRYGINVNLLSPIANSPGVERLQEEHPNAYNKMVSLVPLKRIGDCEHDIGRAAVFLASSDSEYITGQTLMVDGGTVMVR